MVIKCNSLICMLLRNAYTFVFSESVYGLTSPESPSLSYLLLLLLLCLLMVPSECYSLVPQLVSCWIFSRVVVLIFYSTVFL